jgi:hypothetical protein
MIRPLPNVSLANLYWDLSICEGTAPDPETTNQLNRYGEGTKGTHTHPFIVCAYSCGV